MNKWEKKILYVLFFLLVSTNQSVITIHSVIFKFKIQKTGQYNKNITLDQHSSLLFPKHANMFESR